MAEEDDPEAEEESEAEAVAEMEAPKGSWLKQFVILAILVLIGQGIVAYVLVTQQVLPKFMDEVEGETEQAAEEAMREAVVVDPPAIYEIDFTNERVLSPQDYHSIRFLSVKLKLELDSVETLALLGDDVIDAKVQALARKILTTTWYTEMDEVEERESLRQKLMTEVNASELLGAGSITRVYFRQFILQ